jgi:hypothetical protein
VFKKTVTLIRELYSLRKAQRDTATARYDYLSKKYDALVEDLKKLVSENRELSMKQTGKESLVAHVAETMAEWDKVKTLVNTGAFRSLCFFLAREYDRAFMDVKTPDEIHKMWFVQGAKNVLHDLLTINALIEKRMQFLAHGNEAVGKGAAAPGIDAYN